MKVMVLIKAVRNTEAGVLPNAQLLIEMGKFNEALAKASVMLAGEGLHPTSKGARVRFSSGEPRVVRGPFSLTDGLICGFWLWQVQSMDEAIEWVKRCPNPLDGEAEIEIRPIYAAEDFGEALTPELREKEERLRAEVAARTGPPVPGLSHAPCFPDPAIIPSLRSFPASARVSTNGPATR